MHRRIGAVARLPVSAGRSLRLRVWQTLVVGAVFWTAVLLSCEAVGVAAGLVHSSLIAGAATATFWYVRRELGVDVWIAVPCSVPYLCHPLCVAQVIGQPVPVGLLPILLVPLAFAGARQACNGFHVKTSGALGALLGIGFVLDVHSGTLLVLATGLYVVVGMILERHGGTPSGCGWRYLLSALVVVIAGAFVIFALPAVVAQFGHDLHEAPVHSDSVARPATAPFALVDRGGLLAARLKALPDDLTAGGGANYLGWPVIVLCVIAVWPARRQSGAACHVDSGAARQRRPAGLLVIALGLTWLLRGPDSLHAQLVRMFQFATLKQYVEPQTLHILGVMTIPLVLLALTVFLSVGGLSHRRMSRPSRSDACGPGTGRLQRNHVGWTFGTMVVATCAVMLWWGTSPARLLESAPASAPSLTALAHSTMLPILVAFPLICAAAAGLQRACKAVRTRRWRFALWLCAIVLIAADIHGYVRAAMQGAPHTSEQPSTAVPSTRVTNNERECAQDLVTYSSPWWKSFRRRRQSDHAAAGI